MSAGDAATNAGPLAGPAPAARRPQEPVALLDMDGTVCDYDGAMRRDLREIRSPGEPEVDEQLEAEPAWHRARRSLVTSRPGWWRSLARLPLGYDVLGLLQELAFKVHVLTKGPFDTPAAWAEKVEWCREHLPGVPVTVTEDKGLAYGKVLVDDWPPYALRWLEWRPRGLVILPAQRWNLAFRHPNAILYDGRNLGEVRARLLALREAIGRGRAAGGAATAP